MPVKRNEFSNLKLFRFSLALVAGLLLAACGTHAEDPSVTSTPTLTSTPWPTLAAVGTVEPAGTRLPDEQVPTARPAASGPRLVEQYRADVEAGITAIFPLEGIAESPIRIEVLVLSGEIDPVVTINNAIGDQFAYSDSGGTGQPEVVGQFLFPEDGYYELGITTLEGQGEVGVSVYRLDPAQLEGGGVFTAMNQQLRGEIDHPATFHTFRLPVERGQRFDLWATALDPGLDLLFELYGPDGVLLAARDDNVGTDPYLWNYMPAQSGDYTVVVSNYAQGTGEYTVDVRLSEGGEAIRLSTRTEIALEGSPRRSTWLTLPGRTLDGIYVETRPTSPGVDIHISVYDPYGNRLQIADETGPGEEEIMDLVMFPFDGTYQVEFQTLGESGTMEYFIVPISQFDNEQGGKLIPGGQGRQNEIVGPASVLAYWFEGNVDDLVGIDAHATSSTGLDLAFDLFGPDGSLILTRDDVVGKNPVIDVLELPSSGRYAIALWNFGGTVGTFDIFVTSPEAPSTPPPDDE